ncbi:MAG: hypothetical protein ACJAQ3_000049, partial [Planctomycetota bacterium]
SRTRFAGAASASPMRAPVRCVYSRSFGCGTVLR